MWIIPFAAIALGVVAIDQISKLLILEFLYQDQLVLIEGVLNFTYVENRGMAFGLLSDHRWVFMVFSTVAIVALLVYLFRFRPESRWMQVSMAFIVGGGIGNMIDRVFLGYVVDFFDFRLINFAVFNVADSFVCIGAGMMIAYLLVDLIREIRLERVKKAAGEEKNDTNVE